MPEMRLHKFLAMHGIASRRKCEELIASGRVEVNRKVVTQLGTKVDPEKDVVVAEGVRVKASTRQWYIALHKPKGVVCTDFDPAGRPRAIDLVAGIPARLFLIGRLDEESEGLLLMTNDGDFAQKVAHPSFEVPKIYRVVVKGEADSGAVQKLREGVWLSEGKSAPARVDVMRKSREQTALSMTLQEGKNREVRRMLARVALPVTKLLLVQIGPVKLGTLKRGEWRMLAPWEIESLRTGAHRVEGLPTRRPPRTKIPRKHAPQRGRASGRPPARSASPAPTGRRGRGRAR